MSLVQRLFHAAMARASIRVCVGVTLLLLGLHARAWAQDSAVFSPRLAEVGVASVPAGLTPAAWGSMRAAIERDRYGLRRDRDVYRAINHAQRLDVVFTPEGVEVAPRAAEGSWHWGLRLTGYAYGEQRATVATPERVVIDNRIEYRRGDVVEWYVNERRGVEQGFTLSRPPKNRRGDAPLVLYLGATGDLRPSITEDGQGIAWRDAQGTTALWYRGLKVWDATGRTLAARMEAVEGGFGLRVEDKGTTYPLTIDPFVQQTHLLPDDVDEDVLAFGNSIAISRDTIIVGAPGPDDSGGAAYIFERNQGGANAWGKVARLAAIVQSDTNFGTSVAIEGDTAVVGVNFQEEADTSAGAAYIFDRNQGGANTWGLVSRLTASDSVPGRRFGLSVAISGDTVVVGAPGEHDFHFPEVQFVGAAYIFDRNHGGPNAWGEVVKLSASDAAANDDFGRRVAVSGDTAIVLGLSGFARFGFPTIRFPAYFFVRDHGGPNTWGQVHTRDGVGDARINGDTSVVAVVFGWHILDRDQGGPNSWGQVATLVPSSGARGVIVSFTGERAIIWASGHVHVFARDRGGPNAWGEVVRLPLSSPLFLVEIDGRTAVTVTPFVAEPVAVHELVSPIVNHLSSLSVLTTSCCAASEFSITAMLVNTSGTSIALPTLEVTELTGGNVLKNADRAPGGVGATLTPDVGDLALDPGESRTVPFVIGLRSMKPFRFMVNVRGESRVLNGSDPNP